VKIEVHLDDDLIARKAAAIIAVDARGAVPSRGRFIMAVSGGRTPWLMLRALADEQLPWENVHVVQVDERAAPAGDPDRNLAHLRESLLAHAPLLPDHIHAMPVEAPDLNRAAQQYANTAASQARRRCLISFISGLEQTATQHRLCLEIRSSMSPTQTSR
jgi:6-phosphogluconolactonase